MENTFDIIVIGSGPGGYVAAIRSAQLGYRTAIVEKYNILGGTCTNVGCIPSKALLDSTEHYFQAKNKFKTHGIEVSNLGVNFQQMSLRKDNVVEQNTKGIQYLMDKNNITVFHGMASFLSNQEILITRENTDSIKVQSNKFIIATGSKPSSIPGVNIDKERIITSTEALSLPKLPKSLVIIGGGVIGVEMASIFNRIDVDVTILEYANNLIPNMDSDMGKSLKKIMSKEGVTIKLNQKVQSAINKGNIAEVTYSDSKDELHTIEADYVLVATGRKSFTKNLGLENTKVKIDNTGKILTNENLQTDDPNIYAIGDVIGGAMLAHKAEEEGVFVVERINGQKPHLNYNLIPSVVYTWPEVASVGKTEQQLINENIEYIKSTVPVGFLGRARAAEEKHGMVKVLCEPKYGEVLGVHMIIPRAADLISAAVVAMEYEVTAEDMSMISYPHPSYSEAVKEAFLKASGKGTINL